MIFILSLTTGVVAYITPFTTIGVVSKLAGIAVWMIATGFRFATFLASIWPSGE